MPADHDTLTERLRAVERALAEGDPPDSVATAADLSARMESIEEEIGGLTERLLTVEATVQALHGYASHVGHVNREIEQRAAAALLAAESLTDDAASSSVPDDAGRTVADRLEPGSEPHGEPPHSTGDSVRPAPSGPAPDDTGVGRERER